MPNLGIGRTLALLVGIDVALFGGAGLVGNHKSGWRGLAGDALWMGGLLVGLVVLAVALFIAGTRLFRRRVAA
jgi:uncharacterized membrane protein